jgi:hypothetical protein
VTICNPDGSEKTGVARVCSAFGNPFFFTGRRNDDETRWFDSSKPIGKEWQQGLMYFRNRMYDTGLGRFVGRDPLGYVDGFGLYAAYFVPSSTDASGLALSVILVLNKGGEEIAAWRARSAAQGMIRLKALIWLTKLSDRAYTLWQGKGNVYWNGKKFEGPKEEYRELVRRESIWAYNLDGKNKNVVLDFQKAEAQRNREEWDYTIVDGHTFVTAGDPIQFLSKWPDGETNVGTIDSPPGDGCSMGDFNVPGGRRFFVACRIDPPQRARVGLGIKLLTTGIIMDKDNNFCGFFMNPIKAWKEYDGAGKVQFQTEWWPDSPGWPKYPTN